MISVVEFSFKNKVNKSGPSSCSKAASLTNWPCCPRGANSISLHLFQSLFLDAALVSTSLLSDESLSRLFLQIHTRRRSSLCSVLIKRCCVPLPLFVLCLSQEKWGNRTASWPLKWWRIWWRTRSLTSTSWSSGTRDSWRTVPPAGSTWRSSSSSTSRWGSTGSLSLWWTAHVLCATTRLTDSPVAQRAGVHRAAVGVAADYSRGTWRCVNWMRRIKRQRHSLLQRVTLDSLCEEEPTISANRLNRLKTSEIFNTYFHLWMLQLHFGCSSLEGWWHKPVIKRLFLIIPTTPQSFWLTFPGERKQQKWEEEKEGEDPCGLNTAGCCFHKSETAKDKLDLRNGRVGKR